jgi:hypothetical protein
MSLRHRRKRKRKKRLNNHIDAWNIRIQYTFYELNSVEKRNVKPYIFTGSCRQFYVTKRSLLLVCILVTMMGYGWGHCRRCCHCGSCCHGMRCQEALIGCHGHRLCHVDVEHDIDPIYHTGMAQQWKFCPKCGQKLELEAESTGHQVGSCEPISSLQCVECSNQCQNAQHCSCLVK